MSRPTLKRDVAQRIRLFLRQEGLCHWCGAEMVLVVAGRFHRELFGKRADPDNLATVDHLDSRLSPDRGQHPNEKRKVAACKRCNHTRAKAEEESMPIEVLRERSRQGTRTGEKRLFCRNCEKPVSVDDLVLDLCASCREWAKGPHW